MSQIVDKDDAVKSVTTSPRQGARIMAGLGKGAESIGKQKIACVLSRKLWQNLII